MDIGSDPAFLKRMKMGRLEPAFQHEIMEFAGSMGYEATITSSSDLHFLFRLYLAEKAKEKGSQAALKKAEELILRLAGLQHTMLKSERKGPPGKRETGKTRLALLEEGIKVSERLRNLLKTIGITDEKDARIVVGLLGESKAEERVELVNMTRLGDELVKGVFGTHPEVLIIANDDAFLAKLETMESKKDMIDAWKESNNSEPPFAADYAKTPSVVLEDYKTIAELLRLSPPAVEIAEPAATKPAPERQAIYRNKPMHPSDFIKVMESAGFEVVRAARHGVLLREPGTGRVMCVQKAHKKQMQLNGSTIKIKLVEAGLDLGRFQEAREGLKL